MTPIQYADDLYAKSSSVENGYDKATLNEIFIGEVYFSIYHSSREYSATHPHVDAIDIAFKSRWLSKIKKGSIKPASFGNHAAQSKLFGCSKRNKSTAKVVEAKLLPALTRNTRRKSFFRWSNASSVMIVKTTQSGVPYLQLFRH